MMLKRLTECNYKTQYFKKLNQKRGLVKHLTTMSREIKFRSWDTDGTSMKMFYDVESLKAPNMMQYIGLKDKNGKEIYEGDILFFESSQVYSEVYFDNGCFRLKSNIEPLTHWITSFAELKGNIYENHELINSALAV